ncbi:MAG: bifunctional UDP-N-acetylglucosamine diphosphorylase/glucosamine-1-phosphate N-acetyltransferase GlmU [Mycobacteriales bacterium]
MSRTRPAAVIILAAGEGTRMKSATPKVMHDLAGRSLLGHLVAAAGGLDPEHLLVVVGHGRDQVTAHLAELAPAAVPVVQDVQHGTGHATRLALAGTDLVGDGTVLVLPADTPLLTADTLEALVAEHAAAGNAATLLTAVVPEPTGYGRVLRDANGQVTRIVEHRDATEDERAVREICTAVYAFAAGPLRDALGKLTTANAQGEEYLTDVIGLFVDAGLPVGAVTVADHREAEGVNDRVQLAGLRRVLRDRIATRWMRDGVTIVDPETTWIDVDVTLARDVVIHPNTQLHAGTAVAEGAEIGPDSTLSGTRVGAGARVVRAQCEGAEIGPDCQVGPFAVLRPGTVMARGAKVGTYVETKNADIGEGTKVPHLTYVGDAEIGAYTNVGASSVFVNYDGVRKHRSKIGSHARLGSDNMFVAPVEVGDGAYTGAGTVVRRNVPPGALAVSGGPQRILEGWVEANRPGTPAAEAARRAREAAVGKTDDDGGLEDR